MYRIFILPVIFAIVAGCGGNEPSKPAVSSPAPAATPPPPPPPPSVARPADGAVPDNKVADVSAPGTKAPRVETPPAKAKKPEGRRLWSPTTLEKAAPGVGEKGRGYGLGVVTTPVAAYFGVKERLVFQVQIPEAMQVFKALEGRPPKDHEEFMQKVINDNQIVLPKLSEGSRYLYDPKTEELMVERPRY